MKSNEIDMTTGSLPKKILMYSVPLMLSNVLQVMFNLCDVAVVGKFVGPRFIPVVSWVQIPLSLLSKVEAVDASTFFARVAMSEAIQSLQPCLHGLETLYGFTRSTATTTERSSGV